MINIINPATNNKKATEIIIIHIILILFSVSATRSSCLSVSGVIVSSFGFSSTSDSSGVSIISSIIQSSFEESSF